jgi:hypothetical protein
LHARPIIRRNESSIYQHDAAIRRAQRRKHPEARTEVSNGLYERLRCVEERAGGSDMPILIRGGGDVWPLCWTGCRSRGRVNTLLHSRDEIELPGAALNLPSTERHEQHKKEDGNEASNRLEQRRPALVRWPNATARPYGVARTTARFAGRAVSRTTVQFTGRAAASRREIPRGTAVGGHGMLCMFIIESGIIL